MAKRKNSTALFEVMRAAQQKALERQGISLQGSAPPAAEPAPAAQPVPAQPAPRQASAPRSYAPPSGQSQFKPLGTPSIVSVTRKWLASLTEKKARPAAEVDVEPAPAARDPHDPTAGVTAQSLVSRAQRPSPPRTPEPAAPAAPAPAPAAAETPASEQAFIDEADADEPTIQRQAAPRRALRPVPGVSTTGGNGAAAASSTQLAIDRDRQEVTVRVRYQTVIISAVAALSVIGLAYIVGKKAGTPAPRTPTSTEIRTGPAQPGVLDPNGSRAAVPPSGDASTAGDRLPADATAGISPSHNAGTTVRSDALFRDAPIQNKMAVREPGLNYCVIESYGADQVLWAGEVRDYLNSIGIACTIEIGRNTLRTRAGDYIIVGTRGFEPGFGNTPSYEQYKRAIEQAGRSFPDKSKFNIPQMMMVKWVQE